LQESSLLGTHPQAYDELKKRLLNEYKKLVNTKKSYEEQQQQKSSQQPSKV